MNILIQNLNSALLQSIDVNAIKTLSGELTKTDLETNLVNLSYNKVIVDITAIKNYFEYPSLFDFLSYFDKSKVIILLNNNELVNSSSFLSKLVEEGYYSFTRNIAGITYLIEHPNTLKDVEKYLVSNQTYSSLNPLNSAAPNIVVNQSSNITNNVSNIERNNNQIIIGIQNLTSHAGSTTLMYLLVKHLKFNYSVTGIEMMGQDHMYFRESDIIQSTSLEDLKVKIKSLNNREAIIIDLNDVDGTSLCDYVLYLIDPGTIKLNKLIKSNKNISELMQKGKFVLNRSAIKDEEIPNFEYETKLKIFYNLPNINERKERIALIDILLTKLGFKKQTSNGGIFGIFK